MSEPVCCPKCGAAVEERFDARTHSHAPGIHLRFRCGSSVLLPNKGRERYLYPTSGGFPTSSSTGNQIVTDPPTWEGRGKDGEQCLIRQIGNLKAENAKLLRQLAVEEKP